MARLRGHSGLTDRGLVRGASAPSGAAIGQLWFNTGTGVLYQRTANADGSTFWLDVSSGGIGTSASGGIDIVGDIDPHKAINPSGGVGSVYYNREKNRHFVCTDATSGANVWSGRFAGAGGIVSDCLIGGVYYKVHTFLDSGIFQVDDLNMNVDWLIVGGGGSGGVWHGAGGGAGGFRTGANHAVTAQSSYPIVIGDGGRYRRTSTTGNDGSPSSFNSIVSTGGGGGGHYGGTNGVAGRAGGSGGGGGPGGGSGQGAGGTVTGLPGGQVSGEVTTVQGFAGGLGGSSGNVAGAGGGGAGAVGSPTGTGGNYRGGPGGVGKAQIMGLSAANTKILLDAASVGEVDGTSRYVAGGGGGTSNYGANYRGVGGLGGGGDGALHSTTDDGQDGTANTGGGGGGSSNNANCISGAGGSGVVMIRYALS